MKLTFKHLIFLLLLSGTNTSIFGAKEILERDLFPKTVVNNLIKSTTSESAPCVTLNYTKLILTREKYNILVASLAKHDPEKDGEKKDKPGKNGGIIFQFTYASIIYPYPTLKAYPMMANGQNILFGNPLDLDYFDTKPAPDLTVCEEQVTGDLQIKILDIEFLKKESNPGDGEKYEYFIFTPKYDVTNKHVYYEVSVYPSTNPDLIPKSKTINPSPPYI